MRQDHRMLFLHTSENQKALRSQMSPISYQSLIMAVFAKKLVGKHRNSLFLLFLPTTFQTSYPHSVLFVRSTPPFVDKGCLFVLSPMTVQDPFCVLYFRAAMTVQDLFKRDTGGRGPERVDGWPPQSVELPISG